MKYLDENLVTFSTSLTSDHLGLALEAFYRINDMDKRSKNAITVVLHSFSGLESAINLIAFETFYNPDSPRYISEDKRDIPLNKLLKSWNASIPCLEKIDFLLSLHSEKIDDNLRNQLTELNNLRNWISHGFPYTTTWLIQPSENDATRGIVLDYEYSVDWSKKFPATKFNPLNELNEEDAEKALRIVFKILIKLATVTEQLFHFVTYTNELSYKIIYKDTLVDNLFKR
jgi:hypothetical protein